MLNVLKFLNCQKYASVFRTCCMKESASFFLNNRGSALAVESRLKLLCTVTREFKTCAPAFSEEEESAVEVDEAESVPAIDPRKDRTRIIPPETSILYMKSDAYKATYGNDPVWVKYRRSFKGQFVPKRTRESCIRGGKIVTGSPCPICRDEYLVLDYRNVDLLRQFISPYTGKVYDSRKIHVCQRKLMQLDVAIKKAKFYGYLTYQVPFRDYDYKDYYRDWKE